MELKLVLGSFCLAAGVLAMGARSAQASDIFVRNATGTELTDDQKSEVTDMVKHTIKQMPENSLVEDESAADFILQPSVYNRGQSMILKIEKDKNGDVLSQSEQRITSIDSARDSAVAATDAALESDKIASGTDKFSGSSSATTASTSDMDADGDAAPPEQYHPSGAPAAPGPNDNQARELNPPQVAPAPVPSDKSNDTYVTKGGQEYGNGILKGGDLRAPSPFVMRKDTLGTIEAGIGPSFGIGMGSADPMIDVNLAYAIPYNAQLSGKAVGDFNLATGADHTRFLNLGVGADYFAPTSANFNGARPYVTGDVGYAFTRDNNSVVQDAPAIGGGVGFKFAAQETNLDVNLHYTLLTTSISNQSTPQVLGIRAAMNF